MIKSAGHAAVLWALVAAFGLAPSARGAPSDFAARVDRVLDSTPLIDGHNDLPWEIRTRFKGDLSAVDLKSDTSRLPFPADGAPLMTDIPRMRAGRMGGQFWSVWDRISTASKIPPRVSTAWTSTRPC